MVARFWKEVKLVLIIAAAALISVFFDGKGIPVAYGQWSTVGGIVYSTEGYFWADNGVFGGPGNVSDGIHSEPGCGNCLGGYWEYYSCGTKKKPKTCKRWICTLRRLGITGTFTEDSACKTAYGPSASAKEDFLKEVNIKIDICDFISSKASSIACIVPPAPPPANPPPLVAPCAEWKDGVCQKVDTSLLQGGDKSKGTMSTTPAEFVVRIFTIILGFAGGIALLLIIFAGYKILMSKGKPEGIQQGRDQLISAIVGLVFIIFSFVIFQLIFADIFKIPGITK